MRGAIEPCKFMIYFFIMTPYAHVADTETCTPLKISGTSNKVVFSSRWFPFTWPFARGKGSIYDQTTSGDLRVHRQSCRPSKGKETEYTKFASSEMRRNLEKQIPACL